MKLFIGGDDGADSALVVKRLRRYAARGVVRLGMQMSKAVIRRLFVWRPRITGIVEINPNHCGSVLGPEGDDRKLSLYPGPEKVRVSASSKHLLGMPSVADRAGVPPTGQGTTKAHRFSRIS